MPKAIGIPIELLTEPRTGDTLTDRWWAVQDGKAIFWQGNRSKGWTPQCNSHPAIAESLGKSLYPGSEPQHIPVAFLGRWDEDWGHMLSADLLDAAVEIEMP